MGEPEYYRKEGFDAAKALKPCVGVDGEGCPDQKVTRPNNMPASMAPGSVCRNPGQRCKRCWSEAKALIEPTEEERQRIERWRYELEAWQARKEHHARTVQRRRSNVLAGQGQRLVLQHQGKERRDSRQVERGLRDTG